jgi:hypothetical protein
MHDGCITSGSTIKAAQMSVEEAKRKCAAAFKTCTESEGLKGCSGFTHEGGPTDDQVTAMCYFKTFKASVGPKISLGFCGRGVYGRQWTSYTCTEPELVGGHSLNFRRSPSPAADGEAASGET